MLTRLLVLASLALPCAAAAQTPRPSLSAGGDTNSADAYYERGMQLLADKPKQAAVAFTWARRLDPDMAQAWYAERVAILLSDARRLVGYMTYSRSALQHTDVKHADSLFAQALTLNPFMPRGLDRMLFEQYVRTVLGVGSSLTDRELREVIGEWLFRQGPATHAWFAEMAGRQQEAVDLYAEAMLKEKKRAAFHQADRGRLLVQMGRGDSAMADLSASMVALRKLDKKELVYVYQSKAYYEYVIGIAHMQQKQHQEAREAFARALQEDLTYVMAHVRLAELALTEGDTSSAVASLDLAVQSRPDDAALLNRYGTLLCASGQYPDAIKHLERAVTLSPEFAMPYYTLGVALEGAGRRDDAVKSYVGFVQRARRDDALRARAAAKVQAP